MSWAILIISLLVATQRKALSFIALIVGFIFLLLNCSFQKLDISFPVSLEQFLHRPVPLGNQVSPSRSKAGVGVVGILSNDNPGPKMRDLDILEILEPAYFLEHRSQPGIGAEMREHRIGDITKDFKRLPANRRVGVRDLMGSVLVSLPRRAVPTRSAPDAVRPFQITCSQGAVPTRRLEHGVVPAHHQDIAVADLGEKMAFHA